MSDLASVAPDRARRPAFDPASAGWVTEPEAGFIGLVGPIWSRGEGVARRFGFLAEPRHVNLLGVVQGGMTMTFADRALGMLAWSAAGGRPAVTVSFEMLFVGAGRIGSFLECEGEVVRLTASLVFLRGEVRDRSRVVATCQGTWKILSERRGRGAPPAGPDAA